MRWPLRVAVWGTPALTVLGVALGLRAGAVGTVHFARIYAAPPHGASHAWQLVTVRDDGGSPRTERVDKLLFAAKRGDREVTVRATSNDDGVAEIAFELPGDGEVQVAVTDETAHRPLARGMVRVPPRWHVQRRAPPRATLEEGDVRFDVRLPTGALVPSLSTPVWVRGERANEPLRAPIDVETEAGLDALAPRVIPCDDGWAEISLRPTSLGRAVSFRSGASRWYGALPLALGAIDVSLPLRLDPQKPGVAAVTAPPSAERAYVEVDSEQGRAFATVVVLTEAGEFARGTVAVPPLEAGAYWVVASTDPRGAERLDGAVLARPFVVAAAPNVARCLPVEPLPAAAMQGFARSLAIDGSRGLRAVADARRRRGFAVAIASVVAGALLETLLLLRAVVATHAGIVAVEQAIAEQSAARTHALLRPQVWTTLVALAVALLGFALLLAFLLQSARAGP